jgi:acyl-CoA thioesterase FadM
MRDRFKNLKFGAQTDRDRARSGAVARVGDVRELEITVAKLGRSAVEFLVAGKVAGEERLRFCHLIALVSLERLRAAPIPETLREKFARHVAGGGGLARLPSPECGNARNFPTEYLVRFSHCDPGGIVHFPRYFDMVNSAVEDWFARVRARFSPRQFAVNLGKSCPIRDKSSGAALDRRRSHLRTPRSGVSTSRIE